MSIKSLIKNKALRKSLLKMINWLPDTWYLSLQYWVSLGRLPNLKHPVRFTEKLQVYKMRYRNPLMLQCANKYLFRKYIDDQKLSDCHLPQLYAHSDDIRKIDFERLPKSFVIKTSDGGNGENVKIVRDKDKVDWNKELSKIEAWKNKHYEIYSREWAYSGNEKTIFLVEELLYDSNSPDGSLIDYKFFCFNGEVKFFKVDHSRFTGHRANYYLPDGHPIQVDECMCPSDSEFHISQDADLEKMVRVASQLSSPFPFVRVDLYSIQGKIYVGELTFYPMSGFGQFSPDEFDTKAGNFFTIYG